MRQCGRRRSAGLVHSLDGRGVVVSGFVSVRQPDRVIGRAQLFGEFIDLGKNAHDNGTAATEQ